MSIPSKRAAVVVALLTIFLAIRMTRSIAVTGSGGLGAVSAGPAEALVVLVVFVVPAVIVGVLVYRLSRRSGRRPPARR